MGKKSGITMQMTLTHSINNTSFHTGTSLILINSIEYSQNNYNKDRESDFYPCILMLFQQSKEEARKIKETSMISLINPLKSGNITLEIKWLSSPKPLIKKNVK